MVICLCFHFHKIAQFCVLCSNVVKEFWNNKKTSVQNFKAMGISMDPNQTIPVPSTKQERIKIAKIVNGTAKLDEEMETVQEKPIVTEAIKKMEAEVSAPRQSKMRLPKSYIQNLIYFLDKYKLDYDSMVRDRQNHDQWTAKQFRQRIKKYMSIPEQFSGFLTARNLTMDDINKWPECIQDD